MTVSPTVADTPPSTTAPTWVYDRRPSPLAVPFSRQLAEFGDRPAILTADGQLSYRELASRVDDVAEQLGTTRRLVLVAGTNQVDGLVTYLAALAAGHVTLIVPPAQADALTAAYRPDVVAHHGDRGWQLDERHPGTVHDLHPDLALLLSTSGSTGSPKLVRLSQQNLQANAESIAQYMDIRDTDRAATTLPMHYCYGLSVVNSHLLRGAGLILTDLSVVDTCFWDLFREHGGTTFAGVPHTFDLLDRIGFAAMRLPTLRYVTQAGGRLDPERVRYHARLGRQRGWDLFVMYGQTEATARMAYLPPHLAASHPHTVGVPIPGGSFSIERAQDVGGSGDVSGGSADVGELVYSGPNVMLGYAETPADLALARTVTALRTGDLARRTSDGLYEIVGRQTRFAKVAGLRVDLQHLEAALSVEGVRAACASGDGGLVVAVEGEHDVGSVRQYVTERLGLPGQVVQVCRVGTLPRLAIGKPDYQAISRLREPAPADTSSPRPVADVAGLRDLYAELLNRPDATEDSTFVGLGGDSLSYVETSVRLEQVLGRLPTDWHVRPIRDLAPAARRGRRPFGGCRVETSVFLRAAAIVLVMATHAGLVAIPGGAHVLIAVAGFNFARFRLTAAARLQRFRQQLTSIARIAVPSMLWITAVVLVVGQYSVANVVLLNGFLGSPTWNDDWHFWFIEILVYILVAMAALLLVPWVDRLERRYPFGFAVALLGCGLLTRYELVGVGVPHMKPALWLFALGWAAARAASWRQRLLLTVVMVATVPGFFDDPVREAVMIGGMVLLVWTSSIPVSWSRSPAPSTSPHEVARWRSDTSWGPRPLLRRLAALWPAAATKVTGLLASASLYIYLTHWQVYPHLVDVHPGVAMLASLAAGVVAWVTATRVTALVGSLRQPSRRQVAGLTR